ncbi:MAG: phosphoribosylformylglycinamidine synthase [Lachnospiraceae bacterium]|nr:phosphoribosylformylglycinamidine synthase [Lachnospiraceae bacterium]
MSNVRRIYVEKKLAYAVKAKELMGDIKGYLGINSVTGVRYLIRYDVENISDDIFERACKTVFSEPPVDNYFLEDLKVNDGDKVFSVEYLPGQYDQRADSAVQCVQFLNAEENPTIQTAITYVLEGNVSDEELEKIKAYCINPVDSREASITKPETLQSVFATPDDVSVFENFTTMPEDEFKKLYDSLGLAMTYKDFAFIREYFANDEKRNPTFTEIKVLDTYWSDHCRHTTFSTELENVKFLAGDYAGVLEDTYNEYLSTRKDVYGDNSKKYVCLMDLALMAMKKLKKDGKLEDMEKSDEINACSIVVPIDVEYEDGKVVNEEWLINFKNETHNHPTEIEPFGGAATCLGGAIRDPLSGRTYVYQAMRVTGAADPTVSVNETLKGKLSQKKLVRGAAAGYSSYGNQIGLATGLVKEIYHPNYVAKRMEIGAVMGAAPRRAVIRETSNPGDVIVLLGGRTGRDGCGGATGSSKVHTVQSIETCGAEVQKGNPPTERKIQRLFRREEVSALIKKCNDFGAGGVSVAIGELADGLRVNLDLVPKKYEGLDGTELSISESQERMAVVLDPKDLDQFLKYAEEENLEAIKVADVTEDPRLVLVWRGKEIVNIKREFLNTNGAHQATNVEVESPSKADNYFCKAANKKVEAALATGDIKTAVIESVSDLNTCSQKGLVEMFDSSIGAGTVLMPYGGANQLTEIQTMVAKVPVMKGKSDAVTMMSYGFDPYLSSWSPYHGAIYAVTESMSKICAAGGDVNKIRFTFQEYFRRMSEVPSRWSQPFAALLGAFKAQMAYGLPSIGGKDSMSGTFQDIDVPPTLVSFAVDVAKNDEVITPELKKAGNSLVIFRIPKDENSIPVFDKVLALYDEVAKLIKDKKIVSAYVTDAYGIVPAAAKMAFGNGLGVKIDAADVKSLFSNEMGSILCEMTEAVNDEFASTIGTVAEKDIEINSVKVSLDDVLASYKKPLEKVFHSRVTEDYTKLDRPAYKAESVYICKNKVAKPHVFIPVFPGTNCEYDSTRAFERAGATVTTKIFRNLNSAMIKESVDEYVKEIKNAQIIMFPGGFSAGDEPDGSAKFFATAFQNEAIKEAVTDLLDNRDGLALGICNGFQALIKLGLVPNGKITGQDENSATLTFNTINRHISKMAYTKVVSNKSPWLQLAELDGVYTSPASHGEGRFVAPKELIEQLFANGQVATRYCDNNGNVSMDEEYNINGSFESIEGITSPDGRVLGKMAHAERRDNGVAINIYGEQDLKIFESGVKYFK